MDQQACADCEHPAIVKPRRPSLLRKALGMKPRPAECPVRVEDVDGMGSMPCGCRAAAHGS